MVKSKEDLKASPRENRNRFRIKNVPTSIFHNLKVVIRIRPQNKKEILNNSRTVIKVVNDNVIVFDPKESEEPFFYHGVQQQTCSVLKKAHKNLTFSFDRIFGFNSDNNNVFTDSIKELIESLINGQNCSVFAYGATGAGKTHTMLGHDNNPGITILTVNEMFNRMRNFQDEKDFELGITYLEVYNETVKDLLNPGAPLCLREDGKYGVCISGIKMHRISNAKELFVLLARGNTSRTQHPTDANAESSRSHAVFQVYIDIKYKSTGERRFAKLSMIDLAGSERASATGCKGLRFKEGANINRSLLALGNCINSLADGHRFIPYRDSKLTRLLKDSIGGNCRTVMLANISPSEHNYEDTYNTLKYAMRAKKIKVNIKENVVNNELSKAQYSKIVDDLRTQLHEKDSIIEKITMERDDLQMWKDKYKDRVIEVDENEPLYERPNDKELLKRKMETSTIDDSKKMKMQNKQIDVFVENVTSQDSGVDTGSVHITEPVHIRELVHIREPVHIKNKKRVLSELCVLLEDFNKTNSPLKSKSAPNLSCSDGANQTRHKPNSVLNETIILSNNEIKIEKINDTFCLKDHGQILSPKKPLKSILKKKRRSPRQENSVSFPKKVNKPKLGSATVYSEKAFTKLDRSQRFPLRKT